MYKPIFEKLTYIWYLVSSIGLVNFAPLADICSLLPSICTVVGSLGLIKGINLSNSADNTKLETNCVNTSLYDFPVYNDSPNMIDI